MEKHAMATLDRLTGILSDDFGVTDPNAINGSWNELDLNSMEVVNLLNAVNKEFGTDISIEEAENFNGVADLIARIDG